MISKKSLISGVLVLAYYVFIICTTGVNIINLCILLLGVILVSIYFLDLRYERRRNIDIYTKWRKKVVGLIVLAISLVSIASVTMLIFGMNKDYDKTDVVMVLGAGLEGDKVSQMLKTRLDGAIEYVNKNKDYDFIIVSGGQGHDELISEAEAMRRYLVDKGIDNNKIILEDESTSTFENFKFSKEIIEDKKGSDIEDLDIKVFTNGFHTMRSYFLGKRLRYGSLSTFGTKTPYTLAPYYYFREIFAFAKSIVFDK